MKQIFVAIMLIFLLAGCSTTMTRSSEGVQATTTAPFFVPFSSIIDSTHQLVELSCRANRIAMTQSNNVWIDSALKRVKEFFALLPEHSYTWSTCCPGQTCKNANKGTEQ